MMHIPSVSSVFRHMLQLLHLYVSKVERVLPLLPRLSVSSSRRRLGIRRPLPLFSMLVTFGVVQTLRGRVKWHGKRTVSAGPDVRVLASP
jgi:hypothetical protein